MNLPYAQNRKIVWSIDAFEEKGGPQLHVARVIQQLQSSWNTVVQPVHVLSPGELNLSSEFLGPSVRQYLPAAEQALDRLIGDSGLKGIEKPEILTQMSASTAQAAEMLSTYAESVQADLILVGSHGRRGISRWLLGSFAETLLAKSAVPVIVVGPHLRSDLDFGSMIAPTGFGESAKELFKRTVDLARGLNARLTLYHAIVRPLTPVYQSGVYLLGSSWIPVHEYLGREKLRQERRLQSWAEWASHQGVQTEIEIEIETADVADSILALARKRGAGWIVMTSEAGLIASALLGSITRRVVRGAECPVWVNKLPYKRLAKTGSAA